MTFRFFGHVFGDADAYMDEGEREAHMAKDPYPAFRAALIAAGEATEAQLAAIEEEIRVEVEEAVEFAFSSDYPDPVEVYRDVYEEELSA
jgi:pyruvate dehydrogenase E1 component alpha subunit